MLNNDTLGHSFERIHQEERAGQIIEAGIASGLEHGDFAVALSRLWRQHLITSSNLVTAGSFAFDRLKGGAITPYRNNIITLSPTQEKLYLVFLVNPNKIIPYQNLIADIWGYAQEGNPRLMTSHIGRLRDNLGCSEKESKRRGDPYPHFMAFARHGYAFVP